MHPANTVHVVRLWIALVFFSLLEALVLPGEVRGAAGAAYVAANVLVFFAALLLLAHVFARRAPPKPRDEAKPPPPSASAELTHLFVHLMCAAYVRTAVWFEARAIMH
jgi:hypothetical protein